MNSDGSDDLEQVLHPDAEYESFCLSLTCKLIKNSTTGLQCPQPRVTYQRPSNRTWRPDLRSEWRISQRRRFVLWLFSNLAWSHYNSLHLVFLWVSWWPIKHPHYVKKISSRSSVYVSQQEMYSVLRPARTRWKFYDENRIFVPWVLAIFLMWIAVH